MKIKFFLILFFISSMCCLFGESSISFCKKGDYYSAAEDYYKAIENYKCALEINPAYSDALAGLGEAYYYLGEYEEALKYTLSAKKYDRDDIEIDVLEGHIRIGMGELEKGKEIFSLIKRRQPNNLGAYFGFAEISLVSGFFKDSTEKYADILSLYPGNRKALLSIIIILDYQKRYNEAQSFADDALRFFGSDPETLYIVSKHYFLINDIPEAEKYINLSLKYDETNVKAALLYSEILLAKGEHEKIPAVLNKFYNKESDPDISYTLGVAAERGGNCREAVKYFKRTLQIRPGDEIARFAMENAIRKFTDFDDPMRSEAGSYHFDLAEGLNERNYLNQALHRYKRGLIIDPYSGKGRLAYGKVLLKMGYRGKYLSELEILPEEIKNLRRIQDDIEIQKSLLKETAAEKWHIEQFLTDKRNFKFDLFYYGGLFDMEHPEGEETVSSLFYDILGHYENIFLSAPPSSVSSFASAFQVSRNSKSDYFIILESSENSRFFGVKCSVYSSKTGSLIKEYNVIKTGNFKVWNSLNKTAELLENDIMVCGDIIGIDFEEALINLGRMDGIRNGDKFLIVQKDKVEICRNSTGIKYDDPDVLGTFEITEADEYVSTGIVKSRDLFERINHGDVVVKIGEKDETARFQDSSPDISGLRYDLFALISKIRQ